MELETNMFNIGDTVQINRNLKVDAIMSCPDGILYKLIIPDSNDQLHNEIWIMEEHLSGVNGKYHLGDI